MSRRGAESPMKGPSLRTMRHFGTEGPWQEAREGEFEMMDVSLTVLGLTGIMSEAVKTKKNRKSSMGGGGGGRPPPTGSSLSSGSSNDQDQIPVTAVASFFKNVTSNKTKIGTHLPSLPLGTPTSSFGNTSRYMASWPSPFTTSASRGMSSGNASFNFSRVMKRQIVDGSWDGEDPSVIEGGGQGVFVPETMDMMIGLARGSDMIPLGVATLVVTGEEVGEVQVNLPVKTGTDALASMNGMNKKKKGDKKKTFKALAKGAKKSKKGAFFKIAPGSRYRLDDTAALRLLVKAVPRNGGYDHDGSIVSALSCPTGSSDGSSSETSSSSSESDAEDEYDDEYDEPSVMVSRPSSHQSKLQSPPSPQSGTSRGSLDGGHGPTQPYRALRTPPIQMPLHPPPPIHKMNPNMPPRSPRHLVTTHMTEQRQRFPYDSVHPSSDRAPHPHFAVQPVTSEASTEPGYGDEFEGTPSSQGPTGTMDDPRHPMEPVQMNAKTYSNNSRDTAMTTPATSEDSSAAFLRNVRPTASSCNNWLSCGVMSNVCLIGKDAAPLKSSSKKKKKMKPPMENIFTDGDNEVCRGTRNGSRRSRHDEYSRNEPTMTSSTEDSCSIGSRTHNDMEATRDKLRKYAERMGLDPHELL